MHFYHEIFTQQLTRRQLKCIFYILAVRQMIPRKKDAHNAMCRNSTEDNRSRCQRRIGTGVEGE